jgi:hypothetical protein
MLKQHHENKKKSCARPARKEDSLTAKERQKRHSLIKAKAVRELDACRSSIRLVEATHHISATETVQIHKLFKTGCWVVSRDLLS